MKAGEYGGKDRELEPERERLRYLSEALNPSTQRWMREIGIRPGWRCLEVGAAEGSMTRWMAEQVGPSGCVVAADIDVRFLAGLDLPNVEVRELDLRTAELEPSAFDLAYCRTLLLHLPDPRAAVASLAAAVRPGGFVFAHEPDMCLSVAVDPEHAAAETFADVHRRVFAEIRKGKLFDTQLGRTLPALFRSLGLEDVRAEGTAAMNRGRSANAEQMTRTLRDALGPFLLKRGILTPEELDLVLACYDDPGFEFLSGVQMAVWGRRPA